MLIKEMNTTRPLVLECPKMTILDLQVSQIPQIPQVPQVPTCTTEAVAEEDVPLEGVALDAVIKAVDADAVVEDVNNLISILFNINKK
jgi:hypothetical protein